ncbi:hypothetical protein CP556_21095 [Natrinema sp. CBA1119]|nr:hypothetical protein CP556_21095 [Natrinema sp. CBA1119]
MDSTATLAKNPLFAFLFFPVQQINAAETMRIRDVIFDLKSYHFGSLVASRRVTIVGTIVDDPIGYQ